MQLFTVHDLIECYRQGVFPMAEARLDDRIFLVDPDTRGVIPLEAFHLPRRLARTIRLQPFEVRIDSAFRQVVSECARSRPGRSETWISRPIQALYQELFLEGHAHSVECWRDGVLVGGLYGVSLGAAFFGESMFTAERDASKVALAYLVARLKSGGYRLLDAQFITEHLKQFGTVELARDDYRIRLDAALARTGDFFRLPAYAPPEAVLQAISQAS